jgi:N-sulfoglucosamine sulfohydrolase
MKPKSPNILYLHCHDAGRHVQPYGYAIKTPNLQRLAEQGVLFRKAFCANPTCSPSRAALLTGTYPHVNGMLGLAHRGFRLHDYSWHLAHTLKDAGYDTILAGEQHILRGSDSHEVMGYTRRLISEGKSGRTDAAIDYLKSYSEDGGKPFFLDLGYFPPHRAGEGFNSEVPEVDSRWCRPPETLPDNEVTRADMAAYIASMQTTDLHYGRILDCLDQTGLAENTLVICTTDHGIAFPGLKCNLTDHGIGVKLIMRGPGGFHGGKVLDAMVSQLDIFPTLCDLIGVARPERLQGASLMPLINGEVKALHEFIFSEVNHHAAYEPMRSVRSERWKYIRRFNNRQKRVLPNCDNSSSKTLLYDHGWADEPYPQEMLYDLVFDPNESQNLANSSSHAEVLNRLRGRLNQWMKETHDPLLSGQIPPADPDKVTNVDDYSPGGDPVKPRSI